MPVVVVASSVLESVDMVVIGRDWDFVKLRYGWIARRGSLEYNFCTRRVQLPLASVKQ
jgi:hypothetical protein